MRIPVLIACLIAATGIAAAQHEGPHWQYLGKEGPVNWGKLDPAFHACSDGKAQSPIDIRGAHLNKSLPSIEFHYLESAGTIENNGHTVMITPHPGSYIMVGGVRYDLMQFHFHHPAEEAVRVRVPGGAAVSPGLVRPGLLQGEPAGPAGRVSGQRTTGSVCGRAAAGAGCAGATVH